MLRAMIILAAMLAPCALTQARNDDGRFDNVDPQTREWFESVRSPRGIACCSVADGRATEWDMRQGKYWVPIEGTWTVVPDDAVVQGARNPNGQAIVWLGHSQGEAFIRCFVPGAGT